MDYYPKISAQEIKKGNKQNNLLALTVSCEKLFNQKKQNFWFRFITRLLALHDKQFKTTAGEKKQKNNGTYDTCHGLISQEWIDGRY